MEQATYLVTVDGEKIAEFTNKKSAQSRRRREIKKNPEATVEFVDLSLVEEETAAAIDPELERQVREAIEVEESMDEELSEEVQKSALHTYYAPKPEGYTEATPEQVEASKEVPSEVKFAAGEKLIKGEISHQGYAQVCRGEIELDEAVRRVQDQEEIGCLEELKAIQDPDTRREAMNEINEEVGGSRFSEIVVKQIEKKEASKSKPKEKAAPKPKPGWLVEILQEDGSTLVLHESITSRDFDAEYGEEGMPRKVLANRHGLPCRVTNLSSGKQYTAKPEKQKAAK
jgi:hypothetical protein